VANALFDPGREGFLDGTIDWDTAVIKNALVRGYTFSAAHKFVSDVTGAGGTLVATSAALAGKTVTNGVADANDITHTAVAAGAAITSMIYFQSSAVTGGADVAASAQRLIAFVDTATNLPVTPNGGDIGVTHDNGANKIFKL
jgi:bifunctional ADP-heptose synthase (sugar kinase/adenylyltransferase)